MRDQIDEATDLGLLDPNSKLNQHQFKTLRPGF